MALRIAICHDLPSGGGKRALHEMTRRLAARHEIGVYTLSCAEHDFGDLRPYAQRHMAFPFQPLSLARRPFGRLNQGIRTADLLRLRALQRRIAQQIDAVGYDVVFAHNCQFGQSPAILPFLATSTAYYCQEPPRQIYEPPVDRPYARFSRVQRLGNCFDPLPGLYRRTLARLDRQNTLAADLVLVNSAYSRESLYRVYGIFARVGYLGADTEVFHPLSLPRQDFVLSVGALNPRKGFDFLLRSLALLDQARRPPLVIVSNHVNAAEHAYLGDLARELQVPVEMRAMVADAELVQLYNQAALTVYAPVMEPFGLVPLESMACGTPVVGVREGGVRETVVHGETGLLVERDPRLFADAVSSLLRDPERRDDMGRQGVEYVKREWSWERSVATLERRLEEAAAH